jgi:hypothetical protein
MRHRVLPVLKAVTRGVALQLGPYVSRVASAGALQTLVTNRRFSGSSVLQQPSELSSIEACAPRLDVASPESLVSWLAAHLPEEARRPQKWIKNPVPVPRILGSMRFLFGKAVHDVYGSPEAAREFWQEVEPVRGSTARAIADGFTWRVKRRTMAELPGSLTDRLANPLIGLQSAPGGGKTAMLDTLGLLSAHRMWNEDLCPDDAMRAILNRSIPITITYNSGTDPDPKRWDADDETGLSLRLLHSFFVTQGSLQFHSFATMLCGVNRRRARLSPIDALMACQLWAKRETGQDWGILLLVDEVARLYTDKPKSLLLRELGKLLDSFPPEKLNIVCSTLDSVLLREEGTSSGRPVIWANLPAFPQEVSERHFAIALQRAKLLEDGSSLPTALRIAISDASGHARTLEYLLKVAEQSERDARAEKAVKGSEPMGFRSLKGMRARVLHELNDRFAPSFAIVRAALRGEPLLMETRVPGERKTLRELIVKGVLINTDATNDLVVPKLSVYGLLQFAKSVESPQISSPLHKSAGDCIKALAQAEESGVSANEPSIKGHRFERFMVEWLRLMAILRNGESLTALELFHATSLMDAAKGTALTTPFTLKANMEWRCDTTGLTSQEAVTGEKVFAKSVNLGAKVFAKEVPTTKGRLLDKASGGTIASFPTNNLAFDVLMTTPCGSRSSSTPESNEYVALAIEARFSSVGSSGEEGDVNAKLRLIQGKDGKKGSEEMDPKPKGVAYIDAMVGRQTQDVKATQQKLASEGVLLLCCERTGQKGEKLRRLLPAPELLTMEHALSPTLADRALFLLQLDKAGGLNGASGERKEGRRGNRSITEGRRQANGFVRDDDCLVD